VDSKNVLWKTVTLPESTERSMGLRKARKAIATVCGMRVREHAQLCGVGGRRALVDDAVIFFWPSGGKPVLWDGALSCPRDICFRC